MKSQNIHTMKQPELGLKISELRKERGLTQEELVEKCNLNVRTIQRIEAGEVTPRSYTIKSILEVLGYDFNTILNAEFTSHARKFLKLAWIFGIIYFITGFFEFAAEYYLFKDDEMIYTNVIYISIKLIVLMSFSFFMYGFTIVGHIFKNPILKITSYLLLISFFIAIAFDIITIYVEILPRELILTIESITFGGIQLVFGIALIKLTKDLGNLALATGILEIITGVLLITVFLALAGLIVYIPAMVFEIVLLYKASKVVKP